MTARIQKGKLAIAKELYDFIENEALPGSGLDSETYWKNFEQVVVDLSPKNKALLAKRDDIQAKIDEWHRNNTFELQAYKAFLTEIGYLLPEVEDFQISTENVDEEIAVLAGPQLVVPVRNARYCLNAANARWGSLYDALYGFDVISEEDGAEKAKAITRNVVKKLSHLQKISSTKLSHWHNVRTQTQLNTQLKLMHWLLP